MRVHTSDVADGVVAIDTMMAGRERVTSAYLLTGKEPALIETGPTTSSAAVTDGLEALGMGPDDLAHVAVTHIHLDHAGGVGRLSERFPKATVWVHDRGAPHLADPSKLVSSAARVYGEQRLRELFGPVDPVAAERLRSIDEGSAVRLGGRELRVLYTPGHASHHVALVDSRSGAVFTGDALGIHLPDVGVLRPATPPPDVDVERGVESIERIRDASSGLLMFSHYGPVTEADELCELAIARLKKWSMIVREAMEVDEDLDRVAEILEARTASEFDGAPATAAGLDRYDVLSTMRINAQGLMRYWQKRRERETGIGGDVPQPPTA